jgi:hypothetical protein
MMVAPNKKFEDQGMSDTRLLFFPDVSMHTKAQPNPRMMLFLDTATTYTGYALIELSDIDPSVATVAGYGLFKAPKGDVGFRAKAITSKVSNIIHTIKPGALIQEYPTIQGGQKGTAAARSGGVLHLAYLCGKIDSCWDLYLAMIVSQNQGNPHMDDILNTFRYAVNLTYREWAGQSPKKATCRRCEEFLGIEEGSINPASIDNNWVDALMMGVWYCKKKLFVKVSPNDEAERIDM